MLNINTIYVSYQGEQNQFGIGKPVIFIRKQGCHLRCYKETLGCLCDTPEALDIKRNVLLLDEDEIVKQCIKLRNETGVDAICFTGGDPLYGDKGSIHYLLLALSYQGFKVSIETSGTLPIEEYIRVPNISFVLDYKVKSAGLLAKFDKGNLQVIKGNEYADLIDNVEIKFVLHDYEDYAEMVAFIHEHNPLCRMSVGLYWGSQYLNTQTLFEMLKTSKLLGKLHLNFQAHKLATIYDTAVATRNEIMNEKIPTEL